MADRIEIDTASLRQDRETIQNQTEGVRTGLVRLIEQMEHLSGMWEGPAKENFMVQFQTDCELMQEFLGELDKYVQAMEYAEREYDQCENEAAQLVAAIRI